MANQFSSKQCISFLSKMEIAWLLAFSAVTEYVSLVKTWFFVHLIHYWVYWLSLFLLSSQSCNLPFSFKCVFCQPSSTLADTLYLIANTVVISLCTVINYWEVIIALIHYVGNMVVQRNHVVAINQSRKLSINLFVFVCVLAHSQRTALHLQHIKICLQSDSL
jgi:hypothetical protein